MHRIDSDSFNGTLSASSSISGTDSYLTVEMEDADRVRIWVDDSTTGGTPASYDLQVDVEKKASHFTDDWMRDYAVTGSTSNTHENDTKGKQVRVDLTNTTTSSADYRVFVEAISVYD